MLQQRTLNHSNYGFIGEDRLDLQNNKLKNSTAFKRRNGNYTIRDKNKNNN